MKNLKLIGLGLMLFLSGCASSTPYIAPTAPAVAVGIPGVYHRVERGQSLWRISKLYDIDLDDLARANDIADATKIEIGQSIFIPNRKKAIPRAKKGSYDEFIWPLKGRVISAFGSITGTMINKGVNIEPASGNEVVAARSGKVIFCSDDFADYGKTMIVDHEDGFFTVYARNEKILTRLGEKVQKGEVVAKAGSAGRQKNVYLHFEIRKGHLPQNPYFYLP
jgi:murein DD-endopeptidase MepM/ murein hydrolase activator NlpD